MGVGNAHAKPYSVFDRSGYRVGRVARVKITGAYSPPAEHCDLSLLKNVGEHVEMPHCELSTYPSGRIAHPFSHLKKVGKCGGHYSARKRRISTVDMWVTHLPRRGNKQFDMNNLNLKREKASKLCDLSLLKNVGEHVEMPHCELSTYPSGRIAHSFSHLKKVGKCGGHYSARKRRISTVDMWVTHLPRRGNKRFLHLLQLLM